MSRPTAGPYETEPVGYRPAQANLDLLLQAADVAGVQLGAYDRRILTWLAGYEAATVDVIVGLIARAHDSAYEKDSQ